MRLKSFCRLALLAVVAVIGLSLDIAPASASASASTQLGCLPAAIQATLSTIRSKFGPIEIVSTFRPGARIAGSDHMSYHATCRAVDFHPASGSYGRVLSWLRANFHGGLGTYSCAMHHIHIDNGPNVRFNHCVTAWGAIVGGKKTRYARKRSQTVVASAIRTRKTTHALAKVRPARRIKLEVLPAP